MARDRADSQFFWTEVEEQQDRNFLPLSKILLIPERFLPQFHTAGECLLVQSLEGVELLENSVVRILVTPLDFPGGEPLRQYQILFKSPLAQAVRLELRLEGQPFLEADL